MLKRYLEMLERAFSAMTSLGGTDATWVDYFQVVGLELLTLLVGIVYILILAAIVAVPTIGIMKIVKSEKIGGTWKNIVKM